jgi:hypothetical protein
MKLSFSSRFKASPRQNTGQAVRLQNTGQLLPCFEPKPLQREPQVLGKLQHPCPRQQHAYIALLWNRKPRALQDQHPLQQHPARLSLIVHTTHTAPASASDNKHPQQPTGTRRLLLRVGKTLRPTPHSLLGDTILRPGFNGSGG